MPYRLAISQNMQLSEGKRCRFPFVTGEYTTKAADCQLLRRGFLPSAVDSSAVRSNKTEKAEKQADPKRSGQKESRPKEKQIQREAPIRVRCRKLRQITPNRCRPLSTTAKPPSIAANYGPPQPGRRSPHLCLDGKGDLTLRGKMGILK